MNTNENTVLLAELISKVRSARAAMDEQDKKQAVRALDRDPRLMASPSGLVSVFPWLRRTI